VECCINWQHFEGRNLANDLEVTNRQFLALSLEKENLEASIDFGIIVLASKDR
jgi:hypothetical protein